MLKKGLTTNKKIAKNTGFLYVRMLLMMGIAFFSSRILLRELGISDFGLYGVIGGVVAMFSSLRGIFASSIQRFLNVEMGKGNIEELKKIFSTGVTIHILVSLVFLVLAETVGLWFLNSKLIIEPSRLTAANWAYQFSILASIVTIMTIPYDAVIIANERMKAFAYLSILDATLKLSIIFLISVFGGDKLIFYAFLILCVSLLTRIVSMIYCTRNFEESKYKFLWDRTLFKQIGGFAGWNFLGNSAFTFSNEGVNMLLNIFGGTPVNAARGIAYQVKSVTSQFTSNILIAVNPQLIKLYSQNKEKEFTQLFFFVSKTSFFVMFILSLPIFFLVETVLTLWLVMVPPYTVIFVKLILVFLSIRIFHGPIDILYKASGKIKSYQLIEAATLFLNLPISYILLKNNFKLESVFVVMIFIEILNLIAILKLAQKRSEMNLTNYLKSVLLPCLWVSSIAIPFSYLLMNSLNSNSLLIQFAYLIGVFLITAVSVFLVGFKKSEKKNFYRYVISLKNK